MILLLREIFKVLMNSHIDNITGKIKGGVSKGPLCREERKNAALAATIKL